MIISNYELKVILYNIDNKLKKDKKGFFKLDLVKLLEEKMQCYLKDNELLEKYINNIEYLVKNGKFSFECFRFSDCELMFYTKDFNDKALLNTEV